MLTHQDHMIQKVLQLFDGMTKIEAFDILHQIEILLNEQTSPIQFNRIKMAQEKLFLKNAILPVGNQGYCYLIDDCNYLKVYEFKSTVPTFITGKTIYYTLPNEHKLKPLTNQNMEDTFKNTHLKYVILQFLKDNKVSKRNSRTKRLLLMELLDQIDPKNFQKTK